MIAKNRNSKYRWYILGLTMATYGLLAGASRMCMPVLFKEISEDLNLSLVAIGTIWGMDPLAGVFIGLPGGLLADRFGVKRTLAVVCILAGIFGAMRGVSVSFITMAGAMFLFGLSVATTPSIIPKVTMVWFSDRRLALANGLLIAAWSVGTMTAMMFSATVFSPLLGGWRNVIFLYSVPAIVLGLLWLITGREPDRSELPDTAVSAVPFRQAFSRVIRIKEVWIVGLVAMTFWGANSSFMGYLPLYLRNIGWTPVSADSAITVLTGAGSVAAIPMVLLSDRIGSRKNVIIISLAAMALSLYLLPLVDGVGVWVLLIASSLLRAGAPALFNITVLETEGVGATYGGAAVGLANTAAMFGAFYAPPVGNSLADINPGLPFVFWAGLLTLGLLVIIFFRGNPEFGRVPGHRLAKQERG